MSRRAATAITSICAARLPARSPRKRPGARAPPGRAASGSGPAPGSGRRRRSPSGPRSAAAAWCGRRRAGCAIPRRTSLPSLCCAKTERSAFDRAVRVEHLALVEDARVERRDRRAADLRRAVGRAPRSRRCCRPRCRGRRRTVASCWSVNIGWCRGARQLRVHLSIGRMRPQTFRHTHRLMNVGLAEAARLADEVVRDTSRSSGLRRAGRRRRRAPGRGRTGSRCLRAAAPSRSISATPTRAPAQMRDEQRRSDVAPEEEAHHGGQLDVAHAHAPRIDERARRSRSPPAAGRGRQRSGRLRGIGGHDDRHADHGADEQDRVRDDPPLEVGQRDRREHRHEDEPERELGRVVPEDDGGRREGGPEAPARSADSAPGCARRSCGSGRASRSQENTGTLS